MSQPVVESLDPVVTTMAAAFRTRYILARRQHEFVLTGKPSTWGAYAWAMNRWDGGRDGSGRMRTNIWKRIVTFLAGRRADVEAVLVTGFAAFAGGKPPTPEYFLSSRAVDESAGGHEQAVEDVKILFDGYGRQSRQAYARYSATRPPHLVWPSVLTDPGLDASPLFRFLLATEVGELAMVAEYRESAAACYAARASVYRQAVPAAAAQFDSLEVS